MSRVTKSLDPLAPPSSMTVPTFNVAERCVSFKAVTSTSELEVNISNGTLGELVPIPTFPLLVAKLAPVVLLNAPVTASPVEEMVNLSLPFN